MRITMKIKEFELADRDSIVITTDMENFYAALDGMSPRVLTEYIAQRLVEKKKGGSHGTL